MPDTDPTPGELADLVMDMADGWGRGRVGWLTIPDAFKELAPKIAAALRAVPTWRPMETATKDGTEVLLLCVSKARSFGGTRVLQGSWSGNTGYEKWYTMCNYVMVPTAWMPLSGPLPS